jgi:Protein of unknown function (DUF1566)
MKKFVFFLNLTAIATFFVLFFFTVTYADCTKDTDCKGDRVCEKGICVDPGQNESSQLRNQTNNVQKKIIAKDERFIAYADGTVLDTKTNLMWAARDNGSNINWYDAKSYCENYRGGGYTDWRMPTHDELAGLYDARKSRQSACSGKTIHVTTGLIDISCCCPWGIGTTSHGYDQKVTYPIFRFQDGDATYWWPDDGDSARALPVRYTQ